MSDRILIKEDALENYASKLQQLSNMLDDLSNDLKTMSITSEAGANKSLSGGSCRLSGLISTSRINSSSVRTTVRRYGTVLDNYAMYVKRLATNIERVRDAFVSSEQDLIKSVDGVSDFRKAVAMFADDLMNLLPLAPVINPNIFQLLYGGMWQASPIGASVGLAVGVYNGVQQALKALDGITVSQSGGFFNYKGSVEGVLNEMLGTKVYAEASSSLKGSWKDKDDVDWWKTENIEYRDKDGNLVDSKKVSQVKDVGTVLEYTAKAAIGGHLVHASTSGGNDFASYNAEVGVGNGEIYAKASGGLYVTEVGPDGKVKRVLSPGVSAEVGASISAIEAKADGSLNLGPVELKGEAEAKVLSAEAKAQAKLGIVDGKLNAGLKASAEATLVEAGISGAASVAGVGVKAGASVSVGVGAHADVGYYDGVIKCDVGASLGLGVSVSFEVDVGGAVDAGVKAVTGVAESGAKIMSNVINGGTKMLDGAAKGARNFLKGLFG